MVDRQRLHHVWFVVLRRNKSQYAFVDCAAYCKTETRIKSVTHVGKV